MMSDPAAFFLLLALLFLTFVAVGFLTNAPKRSAPPKSKGVAMIATPTGPQLFTGGALRRLAFIVLMVFAAVALSAMLSQAETFDERRAVVVDGDTLALGTERVRIVNIDAPESFRPRCERELIAGLQAKARLAELLRGKGDAVMEPPSVAIYRHGKDRYGRTLARLKVFTSGVKLSDVGEILLAEGLALPWRDGRKAWEERRRAWCGPGV